MDRRCVAPLSPHLVTMRLIRRPRVARGQGNRDRHLFRRLVRLSTAPELFSALLVGGGVQRQSAGVVVGRGMWWMLTDRRLSTVYHPSSQIQDSQLSASYDCAHRR